MKFHSNYELIKESESMHIHHVKITSYIYIRYNFINKNKIGKIVQIN